MTDYSNWKMLISERSEREEEYLDVVDWCNAGNEYTIEKDDTYYRVVPVESVSDEEKQSVVRAVRNSYLQEYDFTQLPDAPFTAEAKELYARYRQYLRDYTKGENWWLQYPLTFEEWSA